MIAEVWRYVPGYEGLYMVSNKGRVKSLNYNNTGEEKIVSQYLSAYDGRFMVHLCRSNKKVHRVVALAFIPIPDKYKGIPIDELDVHHINFIPTDNRVENLVWLTKKEHMEIHKAHRGVCIVQCSLDDTPIREWASAREAERELKKIGIKVHNEHIIECCKGRRKTTAGSKWVYKKK